MQEEAKIEIDKHFQAGPSGALWTRAGESKSRDAESDKTKQERNKWTTYSDPKNRSNDDKHTSRKQLQGKSRKQPTKAKEVRCFRCNQKGHIGKGCPRYGDAENEKRRLEAEAKATSTSDSRDKPNEEKRVGRIAITCAELCQKGALPEANEWLFDTGASDHMISHRERLENFQEGKIKVYVANGQAMTVEG